MRVSTVLFVPLLTCPTPTWRVPPTLPDSRPTLLTPSVTRTETVRTPRLTVGWGTTRYDFTETVRESPSGGWVVLFIDPKHKALGPVVYPYACPLRCLFEVLPSKALRGSKLVSLDLFPRPLHCLRRGLFGFVSFGGKIRIDSAKYRLLGRRTRENCRSSLVPGPPDRPPLGFHPLRWDLLGLTVLVFWFIGDR